MTLIFLCFISRHTSGVSYLWRCSSFSSWSRLFCPWWSASHYVQCWLSLCLQFWPQFHKLKTTTLKVNIFLNLFSLKVYVQIVWGKFYFIKEMKKNNSLLLPVSSSAPGVKGRVAQVSSRTICLSSSFLDSHFPQWKVYFFLVVMSSASI